MIDFGRFDGTIAAIATPPGAGGVGIIRLSGPSALAIARQLAPSLPPTARPRTLYLQAILRPESPGLRAEAPGVAAAALDRGFVVLMPGPRSFTGEDVAELHCHGGPVLLREVLDAALALGARPAEPGEFTRRAFLNGRLDLVQAEAIADLIDARSAAACDLARRHLGGRLSRAIEALRERLAEALTLLEAGIDFSLEEHVYAVDRADLTRRLDAARQAIDRLLATYDDGRRLRDGLRCVIAGRPNAGKSTLLNRLLEEDRAIVAPTPGTTRDWLDADLELDGQLVTLVDTAGLREAGEAVEAEGVRRSRQQLRTADVVLYVADASAPWSERDCGAMTTGLQGGSVAPGPAGWHALVWNKIDVPQAREAPEVAPQGWQVLPTSLLDEGGAEPVREHLRGAARRFRDQQGGGSATLSRARHRDALARAGEALVVARAALADGLDDELIALDVRGALDAVGEVVGVVTPGDILDRIFASFCIGK